jgi:hypothetical protein
MNFSSKGYNENNNENKEKQPFFFVRYALEKINQSHHHHRKKTFFRALLTFEVLYGVLRTML